ncbi:m-AAA protease-interacting protein 1, mitochondrial [Caerostris darwini]|uniref:M-AAA protease-interacting protein 1, mitochondrial n=1 Tax=Caerostris darwini TaxID=1538125 RepID=A0AAV4WY05_9ARAC|nr:m-AAA protease-interacting protein 1, mitochondrial [Caerostris darwini]
MLQKRNISSNSDDDKQKDKPKPPPMLMSFTPVLYPSLMLCIKNWILTKFIIQPYLDTDFRMKDFNNGAKQALVIVASYLSKGDFQSLKGLVTDDAIAEIKGNFPSLTVQDREDLRVNLTDIGTTIPYQIGIIFDDSNQKRFAEITVTYHIIKGMEDMKVPGKVKPEHIQKNIRICNYRFIREYTKGIQSDWIINRLGHFKLCHF